MYMSFINMDCHNKGVFSFGIISAVSKAQAAIDLPLVWCIEIMRVVAIVTPSHVQKKSAFYKTLKINLL
jgi:hypothetical protein